MISEASGLLKTIKPRDNTYVSRVMPHKNTLHNSSGPNLLNSTNSASFYDRKENPSTQVHISIYIACIYTA